jgi:hypothetical protein
MQQGAHNMQDTNAKQPALYYTLYVKVANMQQGIGMFNAVAKTVHAMPRDEDHVPGMYVVNENNEAVY